MREHNFDPDDAVNSAHPFVPLLCGFGVLRFDDCRNTIPPTIAARHHSIAQLDLPQQNLGIYRIRQHNDYSARMHDALSHRQQINSDAEKPRITRLGLKFATLVSLLSQEGDST